MGRLDNPNAGGYFRTTWYDQKPWSWLVDDYRYTDAWCFTEGPTLDEATLERALRGELGARSVTCCPRPVDSLDELERAADFCDPSADALLWAKRYTASHD